jgi:hypothetical protein
VDNKAYISIITEADKEAMNKLVKEHYSKTQEELDQDIKNNDNKPLFEVSETRKLVYDIKTSRILEVKQEIYRNVNGHRSLKTVNMIRE